MSKAPSIPAVSQVSYTISRVHPTEAPYIAVDRGRHSAIVFYKGRKNLRFLQLDGSGLSIQYWPIDKFEAEYSLMEGYPLKQAVGHYLRAATEFGATDAARAALEQLKSGSPIAATAESEEEDAETNQENDMAKAKSKKAAKKSTTTTTKKTNGAANGVKKEGVGSFIKELVMAGKTTDADIVAAARKKFPDRKIGDTYASWYRSALKKEGKNPPDAVKAE